jgi:hypothetical protein
MGIDIAAKLKQARKRTPDFDPLAAARRLWAENQFRREQIEKNILGGNGGENRFDPALLDQSRVFHIGHIRKTCIDYRLRFLDTKYFRGDLPEEAITQVREIEDAHGIALSGFRIMAPTKAFKLLNYNDPLLFAPIDEENFYLVHQWGNDLNRWRKLSVWPLRHLGTFTVLCVLISALVTSVFPVNKLGTQIHLAEIIVFLFAFKSIFAVAMYGFFMRGRKFSAQMWDSRFFNG